MATIAITLAYDGTRFSGFARQDRARTVQEELEKALETLAATPIETVCAGRTDAGVHATGQTVSCMVPDALVEHPEKLIRSLNALTPDDIAIRAINAVDEGFSARFDAIARQYRYRIAQGDSPPLFTAHISWYVPHRLDVEAMEQAAHYLVGEHDFASFCVARSAHELHEQNLSTCREVFSITFEEEIIVGEPILAIVVRGNAFLHSMVRVMVGTLVEVGRSKRDPLWVRDVLEARNRIQAGPTAPAQGLVLEQVEYALRPSEDRSDYAIA